ncbi:MAG TPA: maleylacetate reductase [Actinomycetes bacterium]|nr:maleylacetate reductase [Actinomycetes bacterium]
MDFAHEWPAQRVVFASGAARRALATEVAALGASRVMVLAAEAERPLADEVTAGLPVALRHHEVVMHVPVEVAERARKAAATHQVDALVCVGGGSTTGLAKAIALTSSLPIVAVPTTYAGSEATSVWGMTEASRKTTGADPRVLPRAVVYDAALTLSLPVALSVASGLNALAHCVDSLWAPRADPLDRALAGEGIRALAAGLPAVVANPDDLAGREQALLGAYLAATAFSSAGSGLHHKICHVLGGMFNLPHAQTHAVVLGHVLALNAPNAPQAAARVANALGAPDALSGLAALRDRLDAPRALRDLGLAEDDLQAAVDPILAAAPADNPTPLTRDTITRLLHAAWEGAEPR